MTDYVRKVNIVGQSLTLDVDTLATESTVTREIDTSTETSPITLLTPASGKRISTRGVIILTDSSSGEIEMYYENSGVLIFKAYCSKFQGLGAFGLHLRGETNESVLVSWSGLSTGAKIFVALTYKEEG